jgi:hypothetical protein
VLFLEMNIVLRMMRDCIECGIGMKRIFPPWDSAGFCFEKHFVY